LPAEYKAGEWYVGMDLSDPWEWPDGPRGYLKAIDPLTGKTKWEDASDIPRFSGVLSTGGGGVALCGACTVHLNGEAIRSCSIPMSDVAGKKVVTIEGLDPKGEHPVQVAWRNLSVPQCGYCQAGQIMQAAALLAKTPAPTDEQIDTAMYGNICRCGCYQRIHSAVRAAAKGT